MTTGSDACAWSTIPTQTWGGSSCSGPTTAAPTHTGQYVYTQTLLPVSGPDSVVIACTSTYTTLLGVGGVGPATYCQDSTPISTITPVQTTPTGSPAIPSCNAPGNPQDEVNWDRTSGFVPNVDYFKAAIGYFCSTNCQGQKDCLTAAGMTLDGQSSEFKTSFPCYTAQKNNSALSCEPPDWEASAIVFNIGLKLINPQCTWTVDPNSCYSDLSNSLTGCPAGALDWNECVAWTVGAGAAPLKLADWNKVKVPP